MNVVSFFAGCGGLDLGFEQAGFRVVWANESEPAVRDTYIRNHPKTAFVLDDIRHIKPETIPDCDGFIGGPPCQSWSIAGKQRGLADQRGQLFLTYIDLIKAKAPKFFLIENVKGLLDEKFKDVFTDFLIQLETAGYNVQWKLLDAVNYKIPQHRERVFIVGFRKDLNATFQFPLPTCSQPITLNQAIGDITEAPRRYLKEKIDSANPIRHNHDVYVGAFGLYYQRGNRRRPWERPSFTIHATGENAPLHPSSPKMLYWGYENWSFQPNKEDYYRRLSVRECARIQTFPDNFIFDSPDILALYRMIGNAVPPRLGQVLANAIKTTLTNVKIKTSVEVKPHKDYRKAHTLVGYFKNDLHRNLILKHSLYYVRSDGRKGTMFKEDCTIMPEYLLLHHKEKAELYSLVDEEPLLVDASYLETLGFETTGKTYLCFRLKHSQQKNIQDWEGATWRHSKARRKYAPYFTTLDKVIDFTYERK